LVCRATRPKGVSISTSPPDVPWAVVPVMTASSLAPRDNSLTKAAGGLETAAVGGGADGAVGGAGGKGGVISDMVSFRLGQGRPGEGRPDQPI